MPVLGARWVVPGDGAAIADGLVAVRDGRVAWVGSPLDAGAPAGPVRRLGRGVLMPGPVNAHCHLELSHLAGAVDASRGFVGWVEDLVRRRENEGTAPVLPAAGRAIADLAALGTSAVGDVSNALAHVPLLAASPLSAVVFHELLAWDPDLAPRALAEARRRIEACGGPHPRPGLEIRLAAHAPHSVSPRLFALLAEDGGPRALHLAESPEEARFLADGDDDWGAFLARRGLGHVRFDPPRRSPAAYADTLGALHPALVAAHAVQVDADDARLLAARGVAVALCPRSNATLGVGVPPLPLLLQAGVRLCLGTDSLASAPSLDVLQDAAALHRAFPSVPAEVLVRMATRGGAEALGFPELGLIEPGRAAALAYCDAEEPMGDPLGFLVSGEARPRRVEAT